MKKILIFMMFLVTITSFGQAIKVNVTGTDPTSGKKVKAELLNIILNPDGGVRAVYYTVWFYESDNTTPAIAAGTSDRYKKLIASYEKEFQVGMKSMLSTTKVYSPLTDTQDPPVAIPNAVLISDYLREKAINSYPGVGGADPLSKLAEGILKEIIDIQNANEEIL